MKGFTLIELIIYIAIVSVVLILVSSFMWDIIQGSVVNDCWRETQQNARFAMEEITRELRKGSDPSIFKVKDRVLYKNDIALTTNQVEVVGFTITPISNTYKVYLEIEYYNPYNKPEYNAVVDLNSSVALLPGGVSPPQGCWGTGGSCDPECRYSSYGSLTDYFADPGCWDSCNAAGSFWVNPSGTCSQDGSGTCYKMENLSREYTSCIQAEPCEGECKGTCTPCNRLPFWQCRNQRGCRLTPTIPPRCVGTCTKCEEFEDPDSCGPSAQDPQYGCLWEDTKWFWNLKDPLEGYSSYINCEWYVR